MRYENVTIGGDFEYFLADWAGRPFPSCGLIGGTKEQPRSMGEEGYLITEDNVMVEYNIPPAKEANEFAEYVTHGFNLTTKYLPPSLQPVIQATMDFEKDFLMRIPQAMQFGCMPDFNAWDVTKNPRPNSDVDFRSAAGHVHIGYDNPDTDASIDLIRAADIFASLPSVWEDKDRKRRSLYGKAGACRFKEYGCEHRVLGNYWISSKTSAAKIFKRYHQAIDFLNGGGKIDPADFTLIQQAINTYDEKLARDLYTKYGGKDELPKEISDLLGVWNAAKNIRATKSAFIPPGSVYGKRTDNYRFDIVWDGEKYTVVEESIVERF